MHGDTSTSMGLVYLRVGVVPWSAVSSRVRSSSLLLINGGQSYLTFNRLPNQSD